MKFDLHTHHYRCGHAADDIEDYIKAAIAADLHVIGISDHSPYFAEDGDHPFQGLTMAKSEFSSYIEEIVHLKEKYKNDIEVLAGVESDYFPASAEIYRMEYAKYPLDYITGSVHFVDGINIFDKSRWDGMKEEEILRVKEDYYKLIQLSAKSGMFHILGHIDAIKGYFPEIAKVQTIEIDNTLQVIADEDIAIEINTSGKMKDCGGWYPAGDILERACYFGVPVSFGSDSHHPERVGEDWAEVQAHLKEIGYTEWRFYRKQKPVVIPL
ncbi:histidinol-phosphatase [Alteribacillus sp. HJP-4]|uniref:histidinol-phosphatase n=1 Tax=Alteribacillus sp. HJP-4 TaxID=2775394 RepID=UPI0035CCFA6C